MASSKTGPPPALLERLYGTGKVLSLQQLVIRLSGLSKEAAHLRDTLLTPLDHPDYALHLLSNTFCVVKPGAPPLRDGFSLQQASSQMQLIHRAIEALLQAQQRPDNVLCYGCRTKRPSMSGQQLAGTTSAEAFHHNSIAASLEAPVWQLLLSRIGDTLMLYLLLHVSMFTRLPNNCCLQLTGRPIAQVARNWRFAAAQGVAEAAAEAVGEAPRTAVATAVTQGCPHALHPASSVPTQQGRQRGQASGSAAPSSDGRFDGSAAQPSLATASSPEEQQAQREEAAPQRRQRPSSWQRKKAAAARQSADSAAIAADMDTDPALSASLFPPTQPLDGTEAAEFCDDAQPVGVARQAQAQSSYAPTQWPWRMPKPSSMTLTRQPIFYCATFPPKPGFPSKHVLSVLKGRKDAGRVLHAAIFNPANSPVGREGRAYSAVQIAVPQPARRVPAKHQHLLPLLQRLAERAAKCPFGILLNLYCPLPRHLRGPATAAPLAVAPAAEPAASAVQPTLDTLMDELFDLEQRVGGQGERGGVRQAGSVCALSQGDGAGQAGGSRKRSKQTGLNQLIVAAGSSLQPAMLVGAASPALQDSVHGSDGGGSSGVAAQHVGFCKTANESQDMDAAGANILATQPLSELEEMQLEMQAAQESGAPSLDGVAAAEAPQPSAQEGPDGAEALAACFVPHAQVCGFVWAAVRRIVPPAMLGNKRSQRALQAAIRRFISLRRYEQMTVHQAMQGLSSASLAWLHPQRAQQGAQHSTPPRQAASQQRQLCLWLGWLFCIVVMPLLRAHFYCTESEAYRQQVFYYRKPVWARLAAGEVRKLQEAQFTPLTHVQAQEILQRRKLGVARLRLLPKRVGMRFIINLGARSSVVFRGAKRLPRPGLPRSRFPPTTLTFKPVNDMLSNLYQVLKLEASRQGGLIGASVFGYNDTYCRLQPFVRRWRAAAATAAGAGAASGALSPSPYLVSVDVTRAFDHVDIKTLLALAEPLLLSEQYLVLKYCEVVPSLGAVKVIPRRMAIAGGPAQVDFPLKAAQLAASCRNKVFTDQVVYERISRLQALTLLRQHLQANLVRLRQEWHYQSRGIAQGSTLSTLLCCLYLAHVERTSINPIIASGGAIATDAPPCGTALNTSSSVVTTSRGRLTALAQALDSSASHAAAHTSAGGLSLAAAPRPTPRPSAFSQSLLMRIVDDWLLVTPSLAVAEGVARAVMQGFPQFNIVVNPDKTKLSFPLALPGGRVVAPGVWSDGDGRRFMKWCGLLIDVATLEVQGDYTRYIGEHISTALTLPLRRNPGAALPNKLCLYLRPKVHPLLLDPAINSPDTARLNVYQAFMLGAMKFHCFVRAMPAPPAPGSAILMTAIEAGIAFMCTMARARNVAPMLHPQEALLCSTAISRRHIRYLGLHAFRRVLRRKQALYAPGVLKDLEEALAAPACAQCAAQLAAAVDPRRSLAFDAIMY